MKRHLTASPTIEVGAREGQPERTFTSSTLDAFGASTETRALASERSVTALASVSEWTHTLVLSGALTHRSAHSLEVEIERLCASGVTTITLDLDELTQIDSIGVAVIAFRSGLCKRRGYEFALVGGSRGVRRAFEQAGVAYLLPLPGEEVAGAPEPARLRPLVLAHS
ncbi:MAG TPA: STAS domain-containing protein [Solirubrobacteraceae bacterium]|jgi:anti-anti-sigma factor|nr:STAS domain-containing protein [Solirubrobacteraceae bacterium]